MTNETGRDGLLRAAAVGALAGLAGGAALMLVERGGQKLLLPEGSGAEGMAQRAVEAVAREHGASLEGAQAVAAGAAVQLGYCALWGALYGVAHRALGAPAALDGLVLAGLSYAATMSEGGLLPRLGVIAPPTHQSMEQTAVPVGAHVAFGVTTAAVFSAAA